MTMYAHSSGLRQPRRGTPFAILLALLFAGMLASARPAQAVAITVTTLADEDDGTIDPNVGAGTSLREAIRFLNGYGGYNTIAFAPNLTGEILLTGSLPDIIGNINIVGPGANKLAVSLPSEFFVGYTKHTSWHIFSSATISIRALKLQAYHAGASDETHDDYGLILNQGTLTLTECVITGGAAKVEGGGVSNQGTLNVIRCTLYHNAAHKLGGGIANRGTLTLSNSTLSDNFTVGDNGLGGGLYNTGSAVVEYCTFFNNFSSGSYVETGGDSRDNRNNWNIVRNVGGGVSSNPPTQPGSSSARGGAIFSDGGSTQIGGTILYQDPSLTQELLSYGVTSSNYDSRRGVLRVSEGHNISNDNTGPDTTLDRRNTDPLLDFNPDIREGFKNFDDPLPTLALLQGSPAIDMSDATYAPATDQRGVARSGAAPDIGAYEFPATLRLIVTDISPSRITAGVVNVTLVLQNTGNVPVQNIRVSSARLNNLAASAINDKFALAPGATRGLTMSFNGGNKGIPSGYLPFVLSGTYTGGTFNVGVKINVPAP